mgnify:CR=1 FL=1
MPPTPLRLLGLLLAATGVACGPPSSYGGFSNGGPSDDDDDDATPEWAPPGEGLDDNYWPESQAPSNYQGTGAEVGDRLRDFELPDQYGEQVSMTQFYGGLTLLVVGASWCEPCRDLAEAMPGIEEDVQAQVDAVFWPVELLAAGSSPGRITTVIDAAAWAEQFDASGPVFWGVGARDWAADHDVNSFPTLYLVDPGLQVRGVLSGWPGAAALTEALVATWAAFAEDEPDWTNPFPFDEAPRHP